VLATWREQQYGKTPQHLDLATIYKSFITLAGYTDTMQITGRIAGQEARQALLNHEIMTTFTENLPEILEN
jgi:hypothetical protein